MNMAVSTRYSCHLLCVFFVALLSTVTPLSAVQDSYTIKPRKDMQCPTLSQPKPCITLSEYALDMGHNCSSTVLELLPGQHTLSSNITVVNVTNFIMFGSSYSLPGEQTTTVTCSGPATLSFNDIREVRLKGITLTHCGYDFVIIVNSVQHFEMIGCSLKDSRGAGLLVVESALTLHNASIHNSSGAGAVVKDGQAKFTGNTMFVRNGINKTNSSHFTNFTGGLAAENSSIQFFGYSIFKYNHGKSGGGLYAKQCVVVFRGHQVFEGNQGEDGGGIFIVGSVLKMHGLSEQCRTASGRCRQSLTLSYETVLRKNTATHGDGGGMLIHHSIFSANSTILVLNNVAELTGGGLDVLDSYLVLDGYVELKGNRAFYGGGLDNEGGVLLCNGNIVFDNNRAGYLGGGMAGLNTSIIFSEYCNVYLTENHAVGGGGMDLENSETTSNGTLTFYRNNAEVVGGGVYVYNGSFITYNGVIFESNSAHQGGGLCVKLSNVSFSGNSHFTNNTAEEVGGGLAEFTSVIAFSGHTTVRANSAPWGGGMHAEASVMNYTGNTVFENNTAQKGGGGGYIIECFVSLVGNTSFTGNNASQGGGMDMNNGYLTVDGYILFAKNRAEISGGGLYGLASSLTFQGISTLVSNSAYQGGGMMVRDSNISCEGRTVFDTNTAELQGGGLFSVSDYAVTLSDCAIRLEKSTFNGLCDALGTITYKQAVVFVQNKALFGGGVMSIYGNISFSGDAVFQNNSALSNDIEYGNGGGLFAHKSILRFQNNTAFTGNFALKGGAMCEDDTVMIINGSMNISDNFALSKGGGIFMLDAMCWILEMSSLFLAHNYAGHFGGAVYIEDHTYYICETTNFKLNFFRLACVFQPTQWPTSATIQILHGNYAEEAGSGLYGGSVDQCELVIVNTSVVSSKDVFEWTIRESNLLQQRVDQPSFISSDPIRVCLCISNKPNCNITDHLISAFPGETVSISVVATGQKNGRVPTVITAKFLNEGTSWVHYHQIVQSANQTCTPLQYTILPGTLLNTVSNMTALLIPQTSCQLTEVTDQLQVIVHLLPCPRGFDLDTSYKSCICTKRVQWYTKSCDINSQTIVNDGQYWIGWDTVSNGAILHPHCPFDYCTSGNTSFPMNDTDRQCQHNRAGLLCGGCKDGHSLAFGSSRCLKCSTNSFLSLILAFSVAGIVLVAFLLICKLTVAMGTINGLVFYANIIAANQALYFPRQTSEGAILRVFITWINLDLGIETCFYDGMDMYTRTWLQFAFPLYIWMLVGVVIVLCHYFSWATKMFGRNPVAVLATLFLLSYSKLLRTIIIALSFTYLNYPDNPRAPVWLYNGNVDYLNGKHAVLFVTALLALIFLFVPYNVVVFFGQWIEARSQQTLFRWISDYRVKAFLDPYYGPFKNSHRYWPGLLLAIRALLLLIFAFNVFGDPNVNLLVTILCIVGLLTLMSYTGAIYNNVYLHMLEVFFLINYLVLAACTVSLSLPETNQLTLTYTSVGISFAVSIGILVYHTLTQVRDSRAWRDYFRPRLPYSQRGQSNATLNTDGGTGDVVIKHMGGVTTTVVELRELLLEDDRH